MLRVPTLRQPDDVTCLPTCIRAVLAYHGRRVTSRDAADMCRTHEAGSGVVHALDALVDAGLDADLLQFDSVDDLTDLVTDGRPVIALLRHRGGGYHAVVVCGVTQDAVTIMDPAPGEYVTMPISQFMDMWSPLQSEGILVGARRP